LSAAKPIDSGPRRSTSDGFAEFTVGPAVGRTRWLNPSYSCRAMQNSAAICDFPPEKQALLHEILGRIADKWTLLVIEALDGERELRFSDLRRRVGKVSQKMLTKTLRQLERDGLVTRHVHAAVPPRVDYKLTPLGVSLGESVCGIWMWVGKYMREVERARRAYDQKSDRSNPTLNGV
jgi:DNA-binding HxlR family transcriptional regulator